MGRIVYDRLHVFLIVIHRLLQANCNDSLWFNQMRGWETKDVYTGH